MNENKTNSGASNILRLSLYSKSSKTVKCKKIPEGSHAHELLKYSSATLGSGNIKMAVQLPDGEDINEWIAVNSMSVCANGKINSLCSFTNVYS